MARYGKPMTIWVYVAIATIPMILVISIFVNGLIKIADYKQFIMNLDNSFIYSMDNNSLRAEYNGVSTRVNYENADLIFQEVSFSGYLFIKDEEEKPEHILLDFGNGDELWLFYDSKESIIMRYVQPGKKDKAYLSRRITRLLTFEQLIDIEWGNSPWEDN